MTQDRCPRPPPRAASAPAAAHPSQNPSRPASAARRSGCSRGRPRRAPAPPCRPRRRPATWPIGVHRRADQSGAWALTRQPIGRRGGTRAARLALDGRTGAPQVRRRAARAGRGAGRGRTPPQVLPASPHRPGPRREAPPPPEASRPLLLTGFPWEAGAAVSRRALVGRNPPQYRARPSGHQKVLAGPAGPSARPAAPPPPGPSSSPGGTPP